MNQTDKSRFSILKITLCVVISLMAISAGNDRESGQDSAKHPVFLQSASDIDIQAITATPIILSGVQEIKLPFCNLIDELCREISDSRLVQLKLMSLQKNQKIANPHSRLISYLSLLRITKKDPPDLSQLT